jgi:protein-L-isoaspartate(D-aspartate) O-methyltransferase
LQHILAPPTLPARIYRTASTDSLSPGPAELAEVSRGAGVRDRRLLAAIARLPRAGFLPGELAASAYLDEPVRISHGQVTTQPSLVAKMVEALALEGSEKVLEVGTGFGYQTALLAMLAREVWSIELWQDMTETARAALTTVGIGNATLVVRDGTLGLPEQAPFDGIIVTAAFPTVPPPLGDQLARGGRLVQPIGPGGLEDVRLFERQDEGLVLARSISGDPLRPALRCARLFARAGTRGAVTAPGFNFRYCSAPIRDRHDREVLLVRAGDARPELTASPLDTGGDPVGVGSIG